ncbi:hypothetical protein GGS20DRAFT_562761 [Poronia punctata]|nr:hypothetical protein GGS20DRAFT_562761 [Poronia punctata]
MDSLSYSDPLSKVARAPTQTTTWRRACVTCTKTKRQCTKQVPRCGRCLQKGILCTYPPARRQEAPVTVAADEEGPPPRVDASSSVHEDLSTGPLGTNDISQEGTPAFSFSDMAESEMQLLTGFTPTNNTGFSQVPRDPACDLTDTTSWFLKPETWISETTEPPQMATHEIQSSLKQFINQVKGWMRQWVTEGHSAIHHRELYAFEMPRHIQDVYTAITMYNNKTPETESTVYRILEERVAQLLLQEDQGEDKANVFNHLSRVQALLCYQVIRLYDGDIRMRAQAEALIPTMFLWNKRMLETAKDSLARPELFLVSSSPSSSTPLMGPGSYSSPKATWRAWIVSESIRRTWLVTNIVQETYQFLKREWSECPGRLPTTMRKTLWDARSASSFLREGTGTDPLLVSMGRLDTVLGHTLPAEVDDFNVAALALYGMERVERWLEGKDASSSSHLLLLPEWQDVFYAGLAG